MNRGFSFMDHLTDLESKENQRIDFKQLISHCIQLTKIDMANSLFSDDEKYDIILCLRSHMRAKRIMETYVRN